MRDYSTNRTGAPARDRSSLPVASTAAMLPFYTLLEHPHRACADQSRPTFAPARRISLQHSNQHRQLTHSTQQQLHAFQLTCGTQVQQADGRQMDERRKVSGEEEKEQLGRLDELLACPVAPRPRSEEDIKSAASAPCTALTALHACRSSASISYSAVPHCLTVHCMMTGDEAATRSSQLSVRPLQCVCAVPPACTALMSHPPVSVACCALHGCRAVLCRVLCCAVVGWADSSDYLQRYCRPSMQSSKSATVPLSFPRCDEAMEVLPAERVQRAADPLAAFGGRVPRMTDNTVTIVAGASRKNTAYQPHPLNRTSTCSVTASSGSCHLTHHLSTLCLSVGAPAVVRAGSRRTSCTRSGLGQQWPAIARSARLAQHQHSVRNCSQYTALLLLQCGRLILPLIRCIASTSVHLALPP